MIWPRLQEHYIFRPGYQVRWGEAVGEILEIAQSPQGPVFWLSCAPHWVRPQEICFLDAEAPLVGHLPS